jgi:preprotein translocase subunit SecB
MAKKKLVQSATELDMALEISNAINIKDITLVESHCKLFPVARNADSERNFSISACTDHSVEDSDRVLLTQVRLKFKAKNAKEEDLVWLEAAYIAIYSLKAEKPFSSDHYVHFADYCSVFHIWPYWREFVQRSIAGFGLPPLTLPVLKFGAKLPKEESLAQSKRIKQKAEK